MYGQNNPRGFQTLGSTASGTYQPNLQGPFVIPYGYAQNIGLGDFVFINGNTGFLQNYYDIRENMGEDDGGLLGVFQYCTYKNPPGAFPIQAPIQHQAYYAGTVTADGAPVLAYVDVNPRAEATMQSNLNPIVITDSYYFAAVAWDVDGDTGLLKLNSDGSSRMTIDQATIDDNYLLPIRILGVDPNPKNTTGTYNNAIVQMQATYAGGSQFFPTAV